MSEVIWPRWMPVDKCAHYIGRTPEAVRSMVQRGSIPFRKVNGSLVFGRDEIDAWVMSGGKVAEQTKGAAQ